MDVLFFIASSMVNTALLCFIILCMVWLSSILHFSWSLSIPLPFALILGGYQDTMPPVLKKMYVFLQIQLEIWKVGFAGASTGESTGDDPFLLEGLEADRFKYPPIIKHGCLENGSFVNDFPIEASIQFGDFPASHV